MKNLFLLTFLCLATIGNAQVIVNNVNINDRSVEYIEVWDKYDDNRQRYFAMIDYGQLDDRKNDQNGKLLRITNEGGAALEFNSTMHILNHLYRNGWEVMHIKAVDNYESYVMRRKHEFDIPISGSDN